MRSNLCVLAAMVVMPSPAWAESMAPDHGQVLDVVEPDPPQTLFHPGDDPALDEHMRAHDRVFYGIHAFPFGIGLTASHKDEASLGLIRDWLDQDTVEDFETYSGKHPYEVVGGYEGPNLGLRGGGASPGTAFRYMALKREGGAAADLERARADVVNAIEYLPVIHVITGIPGGIGRGAMLLKSKLATEPPFPGGTPTLIPLFDDQGNPLPEGEKTNGTLRPDNSGGVLPEGLWYWEDSCSKDQIVGWVAALATLYDAAVGDPDIDQSLVDDLREMACNVGAGLRVKYPFMAVDGVTYDYDLVIMDADGRPTKHHDLNPLSVEGLYMVPDSEIYPVYNVFNLIMGLGIVKGLYHVCGDQASEAFLYEELLGNRDFLGMVPTPDGAEAFDYLYMGTNTNFSNVNMIAIALFLNIWFESDPEILAVMRDYMENSWWDKPGEDRSARYTKQPYFDAFHQAMTDRGTDGDRAKQTAELLKAFTLDPYVNEQRINCDTDELATGECLAVDGKTFLILEDAGNWGDHPVATEALDPSIRPPSNFNARSDPFHVNGGGGAGLNPGGDLHAGYWLMRYLWERPPGEGASSAQVRQHMPVGGYPPQPESAPDAGPSPDTTPVSDRGTVLPDDSETSGGGCALAARGSSTTGWTALLPTLFVLLLPALRRSRRWVTGEL
ncbi:MAG: hypothetical protein ISR64_03850 [Deltaproteobacteria bacterium]|nr:hypothetical protein [Deltaproteobacteria bacterium]